MTVKSPFHVVEHFISPAVCDALRDEYAINFPSLTEQGKPLKHERLLEPATVGALRDRLQEHVPAIEERYDGAVVNMETPHFEQWFESPELPCKHHSCENSRYLRKKWVKHRDIDLVGYLWLKDFNSGVPLDPRFETYGGKLEFPAYNFSLVPQRGTLVLYPAGPHFITAISPVLVGSLEQVRITIKLKSENGIWLYQPQSFPGSYAQWFANENV